MCDARALVSILSACLLCLSTVQVSVVSAKGSSASSKWKTLSGAPPFVIARGGFSGLFADSSSAAYNLALMTSVPDVFLWCDVQLTRDEAGICLPDVNLSNASDIANVFKDKQRTYLINGVPTKGWFSVDFTLRELQAVSLTQGVYSRTNKFDGNLFQILTVQNVFQQNKPQGFWLNIQHEAFYTQHNLSMRKFVLSASKSVIISYISSPEVNFLRSVIARFRARGPKLIFRFLGQNDIEPSTNQTYGSLLKNLTYVKSFASGILVRKDYIWPVDTSQYLLPHTSLVLDAHKEGLEVFASEFTNDVPISYNYSYDPIAEYLKFIDNGDFSVDGVLSDFPITPSAARECFAHIGKNAFAQERPLIISKYGASGDYPGCTDLAYRKAIADRADVLDCPVQMSKDGVPFCFGSIDLMEGTTAQSKFSSFAKTISQIKAGSGIFAFSLNWSDIKTLGAAMQNPYSDYKLLRNPNFKDVGKFPTLTEFLALAKSASSLTGVMIDIEHAGYLAKQGLGVTDAVLDALSKAGYENQTSLRVMIRSTNSSVLKKVKKSSRYELVYEVGNPIRDAQNSAVEDIKAFADAVVIGKTSVFPEIQAFISGVTDTVQRLHSFKLPVYVETFENEFVSQAWDFFSDATVEINSFVMGAKIDGVITSFPQTASRYRRRNRCLTWDTIPPYMSEVQPGSLVQLVTPQYLPPAEAPNPVLTDSDVTEPPLSPIVKPESENGSAAAAPKAANSQPGVTEHSFWLCLAIVLASVFLL